MYDPIPGSPRPESTAVRRAHRSGVVEAAMAMQSAPVAGRDSARPRRSRGYRPDEASGVHSSYGGQEAEEPAGSVPAWISSDVVPIARTPRPAEPRAFPAEPRALPAEPRALPAEPRAFGTEPRAHARDAGEEDYRAQRGEAAAAPAVASQREAAREILSSYGGQRRSELQPVEARAADVQRVAEPKEEHRSSVVRRASVPQGSPVMDTLQHSRERVVARWYALKGVFDHHGHELDQAPKSVAPQVKTVPMLSVFSLAGGTGKTSLVATLGRALSAAGEKVLLTDTTSHGLLPFYFGASELKPGVVRTFSPPPGSTDAAIALVSYDVVQSGGDSARQDWFRDEMMKKAATMQRVIVDISAISPWVVQTMARSGSVIVVPVTPDMNSVISLGPVEKFFAGIVDSEGRAVQPYYLLNQFDASLPLHLDVREVMKQQLGDRLLPFVIRRSQVVSEALA
jgi:cellulose synthase operon protein YhjQ